MFFKRKVCQCWWEAPGNRGGRRSGYLKSLPPLVPAWPEAERSGVRGEPARPPSGTRSGDGPRGGPWAKDPHIPYAFVLEISAKELCLLAFNFRASIALTRYRTLTSKGPRDYVVKS